MSIFQCGAVVAQMIVNAMRRRLLQSAFSVSLILSAAVGTSIESKKHETLSSLIIIASAFYGATHLKYWWIGMHTASSIVFTSLLIAYVFVEIFIGESSG